MSYAAVWRIMFLGDCCVPFYQKTTIGSSLLVTWNFIGATIWRDIFFISSDLSPEDTSMEAAHACVFVVKFGRLRGSIAVFSKLVRDDVTS